MITRPLDLSSRLSAPPRDLDVLFWANVCAIVLLFSLLGSRFILASGELVDVGRISKATTTSTASVVVSYRRDNMVLFEGGIFELRDLRVQMERYAKDHPGSVLLVRYDKAVSMQGFLDLCDMAREVGFAKVLVAAESQPAEERSPMTPLR